MALSDRAEEILAKQLGNGRAAEFRAAVDLAYGNGGNDTLNARGRLLASILFGRVNGEEFCDISDAAGYPTGSRVEQLLLHVFGGSDGLELYAAFDSAYSEPEFTPVVSVPGTQEVAVNTPEDISGFSIADEGEGAQEVTIAVTNGTVSLPSVAGLTFITGDGSDDALMVFTAEVATASGSIEPLSFSPTADFTGVATITVTSENAFGGVDSGVVTINVSA